MSTEAPAFEELIRRVRAGDQAAAAELVQRYEPAIRRAVRFRLSDTRLRGLFDSMDICQSVLASFFVRAAAGQYELNQPDHLLRLLVAMARNKLAAQAQRQRRQRRDYRRVTAGSAGQEQLAVAGPTPSRRVAVQELLQEVRRRLSPQERQLMELRHHGYDWEAIATQLNASPEALRKRLTRALNRVAHELGLDDQL